MTREQAFLALTGFGVLGHAHWFFGNLYEALVLAPGWRSVAGAPSQWPSSSPPERGTLKQRNTPHTAISVAFSARTTGTPKGHQRIGVNAIKQLLRDLDCPAAVTRQRITPPPGEEPGPHEWWLDDLATELGMPPITLHSWIRRGWVSARQESRRPHRWIIHADGRQLAELRQRRTRPPGWYTRRRWTDSAPPP
jgi:hypothetical protein